MRKIVLSAALAAIVLVGCGGAPDVSEPTTAATPRIADAEFDAARECVEDLRADGLEPENVLDFCRAKHPEVFDLLEPKD
jgi:hypothetical protein|tara:strand:- start:1373 stop:1612 length:240 start_codon:yes stop_codon:yes gene_type:complete